jgi:phage shock protein E
MLRTPSFALVLALAACSKSDPPAKSQPATAAAATMPSAGKDPAAAKKLLAEGVVVVDVRTPGEFSGGHVANATNIPVQELAQRIAEVDKLVGGDKTRPVVVYCRSGNRSAKAKQALESAGYTHVVNGGGYDELTN